MNVLGEYIEKANFKFEKTFRWYILDRKGIKRITNAFI
jgi:hypothetical protein